VRTIKLVSEASTPDGMVLVTVPDHSYSFGVARQVPLPDYWIDKYELTNREYKRFVDAGGYRDPKYWTEPFRDGSSTLSFDEAMSRFRDATGRTGPATWELGSFKDGQADFPVGGISWFEASAYARFAGKSLPTVYHWYRASNPDELFADILRRSNFDGTGPVRVGERGGLGPWGTVDMAGNVKEWCANAVENQAMRYILGGAWNEPNYRYIEPDARNPWERGATFGVRLIRNAASSDTFDAARAPIANIYGDPNSVVPVSDALFESYRRFYSYDHSPLNAKVDAVDDSSPYWRKESISFDAAYAGERVPAYLFLPKNARPPYQTVVFFPSGYAVNAGASTYLDYSRFDFIIRSGRALIYPVYQGTYDRRTAESGMPATYIAADRSSALRDLEIQQAKDFFRAIDYLETRPEIDAGELAYYSLSMGAFFGPIPVALEPRIKTAVLASAGMRFNYPPEIQPANFAPRVKVPVLILNGRNDFQNPPESQRRLLELLGSRPEEKELVTLDGGHVPNDTLGMIKHVLDWFDKYLGPVR
jgi:formylglycine-generating enzyme required for sulfatase activity/dienelactone hydrolase